MCIVIDINTIPSVFNPLASDHHEFRPILDWLGNCNTKIVYGGTKYKQELRRMPRYFKLLQEMRTGGQVYEVDEASVDKEEIVIKQATYHKNFNDQAIVAIVIVSHCRWICSNDKKAHPFFKLNNLYPKGIKRPSIYTCHKNVGSLRNKHIIGQCGPCSVC